MRKGKNRSSSSQRASGIRQPLGRFRSTGRTDYFFLWPSWGWGAKSHPYLRKSDQFAAAWFAALTMVTFIAFGVDKWRATRACRRVAEWVPAWLGGLGGWFGGLAGMKIFRHKTAKWT